VCLRRCRTLHEKDGTSLVCRLCSGYDYRSRHRNRSLRAANRVRRVCTSRRDLHASPR
jgi:hypothetical protein